MYITIHPGFKFKGLGQQYYFSSLKTVKPPLTQARVVEGNMIS